MLLVFLLIASAGTLTLAVSLTASPWAAFALYVWTGTIASLVVPSFWLVIARDVQIGDAEPVDLNPLGMVERLMLLRRRMPFGRGRIAALAALAQAAQEVRLPANAEIAVVGDAVTDPLVLLEGRVRVTRGGTTVVVGPGYVVGSREAIAELPHQSTCVAVTPIRALRCPSSVMFDVLEDHTDLALSMIESLAAALVDGGAARIPEPDLN
jgi:hypothetical protein